MWFRAPPRWGRPFLLPPARRPSSFNLPRQTAPFSSDADYPRKLSSYDTELRAHTSYVVPFAHLSIARIAPSAVRARLFEACITRAFSTRIDRCERLDVVLSMTYRTRDIYATRSPSVVVVAQLGSTAASSSISQSPTTASLPSSRDGRHRTTNTSVRRRASRAVSRSRPTRMCVRGVCVRERCFVS